MAAPELPSFDLVVATVDRVAELRRLFASLAGQTHRGFRVLLVDQNPDDRVDPILAAHPGLDVTHLRSGRGLSRARNRGLRELRADVVAFPDDDCVYAPDLLERVGRRLAEDPGLAGLTGRAVDPDGHSAGPWKTEAAVLTDDNLWNRAISFTIFLRRELVGGVGDFDERLGLGSENPWSSGEEIDYLVRAVRAGARVAYDPDLTVTHNAASPAPSDLSALGYRDGASIGFILRKHGYPRRVVARMLVRPAGGALVSLMRANVAQARFHVSTLRGRVRGLRAASAE